MKALDLFAGTGVGVATRKLGIEEFGVEIPDDAAEKISTVTDAIKYIDDHKG